MIAFKFNFLFLLTQDFQQTIEIMTDLVQAQILKKYSLVKKVGSGAYGHVWKVTEEGSGQALALKKIFDAFQHSTDAQRTYRQIVFLHELNHPNIIKLFNVMRADNDKDLYLVFEYMQADLHNAIGQKILKDAHNRYILYQLVKGLKFMHSAQIIHRDLKPSNLLLNSDCLLKICDFGLARSLILDKTQNKDVVLTQQVATRWYRAPQVLLGSNFYDKSADIWSVGCILAEILLGKPIFPGNSTLNQLERILSFTGKPKQQDIEALNSETAMTMINEVNIKQRPLQQWFSSSVPQDALNLVTSMLNLNPHKRPTAAKILKHPFLASFHKPKQQLPSDKVIQPPISDNTKLNLKEYRKLIYERIRKLYPEQKQASNSSSANQINSVVEVRKSVERSITRQPSTKAIQKKYVLNQEDQYKQKKTTLIRKQNIQKTSSQMIPKKTSSNQIFNGDFYRNTKTSNSNSTPSKNAPRYSSTSTQKKTFYGDIPQKHSAQSPHNPTMHQSTSQETENMGKKSSLKQILRAKRQTAIQSTYNVNPKTPMNPSKSQGGFYPYNPGQMIMSPPSSGLKHGQGNYFISPTGTKYQSYTQNVQQGVYPQQQPYPNYNSNSLSHSSNLHTGPVNQSSVTQQSPSVGYQPTQSHENNVNGVYKENKCLY